MPWSFLDVMRDKPYKYWRDVWHDAQGRKKPADRRAVLEYLLEAPFDVVLRLAKQGRKLISKESPQQSDGWGSFCYAGSRRGKHFKDVVLIDTRPSRRTIKANSILVCHQMTVARAPSSLVFDFAVHAAAGDFGGTRIVNVYGSRSSTGLLRSKIESALPRLRQYKYRGDVVRCLWSTRGLHLREWKSRLQSRDEGKLEQALREFQEKVADWTDMTDAVLCQIRDVINPEIIRAAWSPNPNIELLGKQIWNTFNLLDEPIPGRWGTICAPIPPLPEDSATE